MYNTERKELFLAELEREGSSQKLIEFRRMVFTRAAPIELQMGKDIAQFSQEEINALISQISSRSTRSAASYNQALMLYVRWCARHGIDTLTVHNTLDFNPERQVKAEMVCSAKQLGEILDVICDSTKELSSHLVVRGFVWLAFMEVEQESCSKILSSQVDPLRKRICLPDGSIKQIPDLAVETFLCLGTLKDFNVARKDGMTYVRERALGELLLRGFNPEVDVSTLRSRLSLFCRDSGYNISYTSIKKSASFIRFHQAWRQGETDSFNEFFAYSIDSNIKVLSANKGLRVLRRDYNNWAAVFYPDEEPVS